MTLHRKLTQVIITAYPNAVLLQDRDDVLDIHVPALHPKNDSHLRLRSKNGRIRVTFCCSDRDFIESRIRESHILELDPEGIRLSGDPELQGVEKGTAAALAMAREIAEPGSRMYRAGEQAPSPASDQPSARYRGLTAPVMAPRSAHASSAPPAAGAERSTPRPSTTSEPSQKTPTHRQAPAFQPPPPGKAAPRPQPAAAQKRASPAATAPQSTAPPDQAQTPLSSRPSLATRSFKRIGLATVAVLLLAVAVSGTRKQTKEQDPTGQPEALPALERHAANSLEQVRVASGANPLPAIDTAEADAAQPNTSRVHDPGEIVAFIESYAAAYRKADTTFLAPFYSDSITYFDRGVVGRAYVFKDKDAYFSRWPDIRIDTDSTLPKAERLIVTEKSDGVFDIEWRVLFTVSGRGQKRSGRALNRFTVARAAAQRMIIIGESSSVTERFD